ncbi:hypothetical protein HPB49_006384 [Dermacentor silvarum]|uniref:Uncharacterized protein n=1 Tax=Dermacentor silvarum TaxID=543639 RepID=A0ACB8CQ13_DERSI|nr:hypothetical protein HPB49_006384 [Dermacentor silvarum]
MSLTATGRYILQKLGFNYHVQHGREQAIPPDISDLLNVTPIPQNILPELNGGQCQARAKALLRSFGEKRTAHFVDTAEYTQKHWFMAVVIDINSRLTLACSVSTEHPETAEEVVLALIDPLCKGSGGDAGRRAPEDDNDGLAVVTATTMTSTKESQPMTEQITLVLSEEVMDFVAQNRDDEERERE